MADSKPSINFYRNLGGVNAKASEYSIDKAQFLNLSNLDFDVPNALSKRTGSTQAIGLNTSGPINSLFEFIKLDGSSYVIAGDNTAMWYKTGTSLTVLDSGWTNGQPADMLTFLNKLWVANGQKFNFWSGGGASFSVVGLPVAQSGVTTIIPSSSGGATYWLVGGATMAPVLGNSYIIRGVYIAYSYVRNDGYIGPTEFLRSARNIVQDQLDVPASNGDEYFDRFPLVAGFTVPPGYGISGIAVWIGVDSVFSASAGSENIENVGNVKVGELGWATGSGGIVRYMSYTLKPTANLNKFWLYTIVPQSNLFLQSTALYGGLTAWAFTLFPVSFNSYTAVSSGNALGLTGMQFNWFQTNTPKYIEVNQNSMFYAGFSNTPSNVWFSDLGQPEIIEPDSFFEVRTNDGDRILATKTYANQLIVMKENSFHKVIGDSPENFELVEVSTRYGCLSNKTVIEYEQKLLWLDKKGILEYNGANYDIISTPVEDIFRRMNVEAAKEKAVAVHEIYRNQVWFGIPIDGSTTNNMTVVYDYLVKAWTFFEGFNPASFALIKQDLTKGTVWRGDYSGMIYYHSASFLGDNGQAITCLVRPHWDKNKENETWIWRRFFLDVGTASGLTGRITGKLYSNYDNSTVQATFSMFQDAFQSRAEIGVVGKAVTTEFAHVSASLPLLINGYSWAKRFLRNV